MSGYFGTEQQRALQERTHAMQSWMRETPGIYNAGRFMGADDPDKAPWDMLQAILERDRILGFRMISPDQAARYFPALIESGHRIDTWDILVGAADAVAAPVRAVLESGMPAGVREAPALADAEGAETQRVQQFLADNGLAPLSGTMLVARPGEAKTIVLTDAEGDIVATGHSYFPHNPHSPFHRYAWVGLIAVAESARGTGLGRYINARLVRAAIDEMAATHVYEMVGPTNLASRKMVEACGPRLEPNLLCGVAMPAETARFTR